MERREFITPRCRLCDRVLKDAKAAELPMQAPVKFEPHTNLKTANALALRILQTLLATADEVIE